MKHVIGKEREWAGYLIEEVSLLSGGAIAAEWFYDAESARWHVITRTSFDNQPLEARRRNASWSFERLPADHTDAALYIVGYWKKMRAIRDKQLAVAEESAVAKAVRTYVSTRDVSNITWILLDPSQFATFDVERHPIKDERQNENRTTVEAPVVGRCCPSVPSGQHETWCPSWRAY